MKGFTVASECVWRIDTLGTGCVLEASVVTVRGPIVHGQVHVVVMRVDRRVVVVMVVVVVVVVIVQGGQVL